jgi:muconate cycloisomerase
MRIQSIDVHPITMTLRNPIPMASGVIGSTGNVLVRLVTDEGLAGWGEGVEAPALTHKRQEDIVADLDALTPLLIGADPTQRTALWNMMIGAKPEASTAIGAIDIALHDLTGRALGVPAHQLLGGLVRDVVPALTLVGSGDPSADADRLADRHDDGYRWFKIKLGMADAASELATLAKAAETVGDDGVVCGDVNEAWDEETAAGFLGQVDGERVRFIEQPVSRDDRDALLRLAAGSPVALCADESAGSLASVAGFAATAMGGVSLKLIKHGGMTGVMRGAAICAASGLSVNLAGKVIESSISAAANLHCAAAMDRIDYGCSPANQDVAQDVTESPVTVIQGSFAVPTGPGLGIEVDDDMVRSLLT